MSILYITGSWYSCSLFSPCVRANKSQQSTALWHRCVCVRMHACVFLASCSFLWSLSLHSKPLPCSTQASTEDSIKASPTKKGAKHMHIYWGKPGAFRAVTNWYCCSCSFLVRPALPCQCITLVDFDGVEEKKGKGARISLMLLINKGLRRGTCYLVFGVMWTFDTVCGH